MNSNDSKIIDQFSQTSENYSRSNLFAHGKDLDMILQHAQPLDKAMNVLDIATGAGHVAIKIAPHVKQVIAIDITPKMAQKTIQNAKSQNITNISAKTMNAESIQFADKFFDIVTCRYAPHHFASIEKFLSEVSRVLKDNNGIFILIDVIAPEDSRMDLFINNVNKIRDHTHVRSYTESQWKDSIKRAKLKITSKINFSNTYDIDDWLSRAKTSKEDSQSIQHLFTNCNEEIKNHFNVQYSNDSRSFTEDIVMIKAKKIS